MKQSIGLAIYEINLRKLGENGNITGDSLKFDEFPHENDRDKLDLLEILKGIFLNIKENGESKKDEKLPQDNGKRIYLDTCPSITRIHPAFGSDRSIYGRVRYGTGGKESEIRKTKTNELVGHVYEDETPYDPYYFLIILPKNSTKGCLVLEQKNGDGIKGIFISAFLDTLKDYTDYAHCKITINRAYPEEIKEKYYENGELKTLRFIISEPPEDIVDNINVKIKEVEVVIKIGGGPPVSPKTYIKSKKNALISFETFDYDEIKAISKSGKKTRTFKIRNPDSLIPYLDITNELEGHFYQNHPRLKYIDKIARDHVANNFNKIWELGED